jgi:hypothetical protein
MLNHIGPFTLTLQEATFSHRMPQRNRTKCRRKNKTLAHGRFHLQEDAPRPLSCLGYIESYRAINSYSSEKEEEKIIKTGRKTGPTTLRLRIHEVGPSLCTLHVAWPAAPSHRMKALEGTNVFGVQDLLDMFQPSAHCQKYDGAVTGDALCRDRVKHLRPQQNKAATGPTL